MTSLGEMVVSFKADITNLSQGAQKAQAEIKQVGTAASETGAKMEGGFGASIEKAKGSLLNFGSQLTMVAFGLKGLIEASAQTAQAMFAPGGYGTSISHHEYVDGFDRCCSRH